MAAEVRPCVHAEWLQRPTFLRYTPLHSGSVRSSPPRLIKRLPWKGTSRYIWNGASMAEGDLDVAFGSRGLNGRLWA